MGEQRNRARVLAHCCPGPAVYFVMAGFPTKDQFAAGLRTLSAPTALEVASESIEQHWDTLLQRREGNRRWDSVTTMPTARRTPQDLIARNRARLVPERLAEVSGYVAPVVDGVRYTFDLFNPGDELAIGYAGAGEPVLALLLQSAKPAHGYPILVRDHLPPSFFALVSELDRILAPIHLCGTYSLVSPLIAYLEGRVARETLPWEFLFPLHVLGQGTPRVTPDTEFDGSAVGLSPGRTVKPFLVEDWGDRVLIMVRPGFEAVLGSEYFVVAKALGRVCVQQLVEGKA